MSARKRRRSRSPPSRPAFTRVDPLYDWGRHGVIGVKDYGRKEVEFLSWLGEVVGVAAESLSTEERFDMFLQYAEDYNTATLPRLDLYDAGTSSGHQTDMLFDDERQRERQLREAAESRRQLLVQNAYQKILTDKELASAMKRQRLLKEKADQYFREGRNQEAERIVARLKPDKPVLHTKEEKPPHNDYDY